MLVLKSQRRLELISNGEPLKTYRISLGKKPVGAKEREGDKRTPEGFYWLDWRKISDRYNLAIHVSYPNVTDAAKARREGVPPGGMIMIHGTPDTEENPGQQCRRRWTRQALEKAFILKRVIQLGVC